MRNLFHILLIFSTLCPFQAYSQGTLTNAGGAIKVFGDPAPSTRLTLVVLGDFENQSDISGNDGLIDLIDNGHMYVTGNWTNNSNSNIFPLGPSSLIDGLVTMENSNSIQLIDGISPTYFENLSIKGSRKILINDFNSVNNTLTVDAPLILNSNTFEIKNPNPSGIDYISGFIKSETLPGNHGFIKWNTGNYAGTFSIPFGSDNGVPYNDLQLDFIINSPMALSDYFNFATYPTDMYNLPLPFGATTLEYEVRKTVDRYWIIDPKDRNNLSNYDIIFTYTAEDITDAANSINTNQLKATRNNPILGKWSDMYPEGNSFMNRVEITSIDANNFYPSWTLVNMPTPITELFTPDAFSPNGDGINDIFIPVFQTDIEIIDYEFFIFNRWGKIVFRTNDQNQGWNGVPQGTNAEPNVDVYSWLILIKGRLKGNYEAEGQKRKFTGKVTIIL